MGTAHFSPLVLNFHPPPDAVGDKSPEKGKDTVACVDHPNVAMTIDALDNVACH